MKLYIRCAVALLFIISFAGARADDERLLCDKPVSLAAPLTQAQLNEALSGNTTLAQAFDRLARLYEGSLGDSEKALAETRLFLASVLKAEGTSPSIWDLRPDPVNLDAWQLFGNFPLSVSFDCTKDPMPAYLMNMAYLSGVVKRFTQPDALKWLEANKRVIDKRAGAVDALLNNGLPMWPWENYINGLRLGKSDAEPLFTNQWIILRPSAAMEFSTRSRVDANLNASLAIEPFGFIRYTDPDYKTWWGVSSVVTVSSDAGLGYGALLRYDKYTLGVTWHKAARSGSDDVFILLGVDLYDFLNQKQQSIKSNLRKSE